MIVVFGSLNADPIFSVAALPSPGQILLAAGMTVGPGGKGANQAVAAALDGTPVAMAGAVGQDALAATALAGLVAAGVDLSRVARCVEPTGCASICTDQAGRNQIVVAPGANSMARAAAVEDGLLAPGAVLVTQMEADTAETAAVIRRAAARGARTIHNLAPAGPLAGDALRMLDILVVNEDEASWLARHEGATGDDAAALHGALGITVVRTLGGAGVEWAGPGTTGRFAALHRGDSLADGVRRANVAAGLACTRRGSQGSMPNAAQIAAASATGCWA